MATKALAKGLKFDAVNIRTGAEFKAWLVRFAEAERSTPTQLVERGLVALAKGLKFPAPPAR